MTAIVVLLVVPVAVVASGLLVVSATANFFVYCAVGVSFRRGLVRLFSCRTAANTSETCDRRDELVLEKNAKPSNAPNLK